MSKKAKIIIAVVVVIIIAAVGLYFAFGRSTATKVDTAKVGAKELVTTVSGSGSIDASVKRSVDVPSAGTMLEVNVKDGDQVTKGQVLAKMDAAPLKAQLAQAQAQLAQAQSARASLDSSSASAAAAAKSAQAQYQNSLDMYNQAKKAVDALKKAQKNPTPGIPAPTDTEIKVAEAALGQAKSAVDQSKAAVSQARVVMPQGQIDAANNAVAAAQQTVDLAQQNLDKATITAPISGIVFLNPISASAASALTGATSGSTVTPGSMVSPGMAPFTVIDTGSFVFNAQIDEADINGLKEGMTATVDLDAFGNESFEATVTTVAKKAALTATGGSVFTAQLKLTVPSGTQLLTGMKGDATINKETTHATMAIPIDALFEEHNESYVYLLVDGEAVKTTIKTGAMTSNDVEVTDGLKSGDTVILPGDAKMSDGMKVTAKDSSGSGE